MENLTKDILKILKNEHTKVKLKEDFKGNYYNYIIDTIYIAKKFREQKVPTKAKNMNRKVAELVTICHECIHSVQNKCMHILNTIFSNLSIVLTITNIILWLLWKSPLLFKIPTISVIVISIIIRLILEIGAINGSVKLASNVVAQGITDEVSNQDIEDTIKYIDKYKYLALLNMILDKIIFLIIILYI